MANEKDAAATSGSRKPLPTSPRRGSQPVQPGSSNAMEGIIHEHNGVEQHPEEVPPQLAQIPPELLQLLSPAKQSLVQSCRAAIQELINLTTGMINMPRDHRSIQMLVAKRSFYAQQWDRTLHTLHQHATVIRQGGQPYPMFAMDGVIGQALDLIFPNFVAARDNNQHAHGPPHMQAYQPHTQNGPPAPVITMDKNSQGTGGGHTGGLAAVIERQSNLMFQFINNSDHVLSSQANQLFSFLTSQQNARFKDSLDLQAAHIRHVAAREKEAAELVELFKKERDLFKDKED
ncbi:hypothetical protein J7T55_015507 [Diaporthe amygdali]|uniref:uncharacterized protein n=1 Tax=Phomopsis amygdali TaxID=1214568 RepID=UPI0022FEA769|nr:uncharacterized protein J7T55_015507 [Diaporthe amygdali]KAJ0120774.1 hypothetical protein J7T55_015507 [Diaporthe amygdali]